MQTRADKIVLTLFIELPPKELQVRLFVFKCFQNDNLVYTRWSIVFNVVLIVTEMSESI